MAASPPTNQLSPTQTLEVSSNPIPEPSLTNAHDSTTDHQPSDTTSTEDADCGEKRKREDEDPSQGPLWKTSLCSYFRRNSGSCSHGDACRYAHGEEELRPRPDSTWDPTSERAKKVKKNEEGEISEVMMTEDVVGEEDGDGNDDGVDPELSKCLVHLPGKWRSENLISFLTEQGVSFKSAKKKKGMFVGFVSFESAEQLQKAMEDLIGKSIGNKSIKVADVIPRSFGKKTKSTIGLPQNTQKTEEFTRRGENVDISMSPNGTGDVDTNEENSTVNGLVSNGRSVRDAVTPLAHMTYSDQLEHKKSTLTQLLKRLTRNARKACPNGVSLPEWILKSREIGGLACNLEGILASPLVNDYRNKCEFSVGYSLQGKITVGFMLGNFREGVTAVEEPVDCPNVSRIACKYASIFQEFLQHSSLPVWNRFKNTGFWRQLTVREGRSPERSVDPENSEAEIAEVMLIVQVSTAGHDDALVSGEFEKLAQAFAEGAATNSPSLPLTALVVQDHQGISNAAPADVPLRRLSISKVSGVSGMEANSEEASIHDYISNLKFRISPTAFFQVNTVAAEKLYSLAGDWAGLGPDTLLFDICCGTGTIGLTLAHRVGMVVGIEMNASAVSDANRNAEINGIKNCRFVCSKAEDVMGSLLKEYLDASQKQDEIQNVSKSSDKVNSTAEKDSPMDNVQDPEVSSCQSVDASQKLDEIQNISEAGDRVNSTAQEKDILVDNVHDPEASSCQSVPDVQESSTSHEPENGKTASECLESSKQEPSSQFLESCTSEGGNPPVKCFKNVVAIVDPPRGGLHPTVIKALRTHPGLRRLVYISCNPESLVANAIELCTPSAEKLEKGNKKNNRNWRNMSAAGLARHRTKSMPISEPFRPVKAMAVDLFPHTVHCEMVMLLER